MLSAVGVQPAVIEHERELIGPIVFGRTESRSMIGSLTDFSILTNARFLTHRDQSLESIAIELAEVPLVLPFKGEHPSAVTRRLFGTK